ncbi:nitrite reductase [NAD(P)H] [Halobacillus andaensis]|uniref:Nitrite reductase [NAD(P)H] n=1 Tax=Halobacillus andaensis TaxID=1176239 RepID=A0A917B6Q7_HALAA|nr:nitrite reductase large subunit NirB [Halobacillus andaensis]MBP2005776.1 nitrite reductase (NADH) large subunit [Halobacillus andaensis]GGF26126.1 nitrite reductase [NAD(P)H] [Halobacillus andaensis]
MKKQKLVIIGNGMAGIRCVENILREDSGVFEISMFGSEPHTSYSRLMLSSVLQGETSLSDLMIRPDNWYKEHNIQLFTGETVLYIDKVSKTLKTDRNREVAYDKLILATGSSPFMLPITGADKEGVLSFRTIEDCERLINMAEDYTKAVVIGGGLLGLEAARGLFNLGMETDVVHISNHIMGRQLDEQASLMLQEELEAQGMNFLLEKEAEEILGNERVEGIRFKDGSIVKADVVVMAVGIKPNIQLAEVSGIETKKGIVVDDLLKTSVSDIYAVGECAEHKGMVYGLVQPLYEQGEVLAKHLCEQQTEGYKGSLLYTQLKISGVDVFSAGHIDSGLGKKAIHYHNEVESVYKKVVFDGSKAVGTVMFGDTRAGPLVLDAIVKNKVLSSQDKVKLLEHPDPKDSAVASYSLDKQICTCNSVSKGAIIQAVQQKNLTTAEQVKECTKASSSCGGCKPVVSELLAYIQSEDFDQKIASESPFCPCTTLTEDELVEQIQIQDLTNSNEVMKQLGWKNSNGCVTCQLAIDYYLGMIHPDYEVENQDLRGDEENKAIVQRDGYYAVVPQLYGGEMTIGQLKNITNAAERYSISQVAIGNDQRIHLLGLKQEDVPHFCEELNIPLSYSYGNRIEPIRTDIGNHECQCDKQEALHLAQVLEKKTELLQTPYRMKVGISSCVHNGARATTKDLGAIRVGGKWEIYIGGNSGRRARSGQLLCVVEHKEQVERMLLGCLQYYRKSARYLERTWHWMERLSLVHIREALFDQDLCDDLLQSLEADVAQRRDCFVPI